MMWREKRVILIFLALLLAANAVFFFTYRVQYQSRLDELDARLETVNGELQQARATRLRSEATLAGYRRAEGDVNTVFNDYWSTQQRRLTALIIEVKRLAIASSLVPASYSFDQGAAKSASERGSRALTVGATEVGVSFTVTGSYQQVRRLINLLELSRQFVIIDQLALTASEGDTLSMNLHLKTLFRDELSPDGGKNQL